MLAPAAYFLIHWSLEMMSGQVLDKLLVARLFGDFQRLMQETAHNFLWTLLYCPTTTSGACHDLKSSGLFL